MTLDDTDGNATFLAPVREGELVANKYVAGRVLGVGGMGVVLAATDKLLERKVAIKFLLPSLASSERAVQRFTREARAAARITSEHVVKLLEIDTLPSGMPYFVMEYLEGRDLRAILLERGTLPLARAADYLLQALEAIAEGHLRGVVHRDLKPSNLFVTRHADQTALVKVLDFGIAKTLEAEGSDQVGLTGSDDTRLGSPAYMSPEQLKNPNDVDARSDIWALGVTLYELVCGEPPFRGQTYPDLVVAISGSTPEPPSARRPDLALPPELDDIVLRCLQKDRTLRYPTAGELAAALAGLGTEQARASLKRIQGLRAPSGPSAAERDHYTTTLPAESPPSPRARRDADGRDSTPPRRTRIAGAVALAVIVAAVVGFAWSRRHEPPAAELSEPPVEVQAPPKSETVEPATPAANTIAETKTADAVTADTARPARIESSELVAPPATRTKARPHPVTTTSRTLAVTPVASIEPAVPPLPAGSHLSGSRSAVIEKLIENRR